MALVNVVRAYKENGAIDIRSAVITDIFTTTESQPIPDRAPNSMSNEVWIVTAVGGDVRIGFNVDPNREPVALADDGIIVLNGIPREFLVGPNQKLAVIDAITSAPI